MDFIEVKNFCTLKDTKKIKRQATNWEKTLVNHII